MSLWWLSYVGDDDVSRGVVVIEAESFFEAVENANWRGLSPGGQVQGFEAPPEEELTLRGYEGKWLSPEEARQLAAS